MDDREQQARRALAESVRTATLEAARRGYEEAGIGGLCEEGRIEAALDAIRALDLEPLLREPRG